MVAAEGAGTVSGSHQYADDGSYVLKVTITDSETGSGEDSTSVTVTNVAPTLDAGPDKTAQEGQVVALDGTTFFDPGLAGC